MPSMHEYTDETEALARSILAFARGRIAADPPLDHALAPEELDRRAGRTITSDGIGGTEALRLWSEVLAPATLSPDHPSFLAFVPGAPTKASVLFDLAVSASATYAGSWLEGAGAVWAENQVLAWLAALAGFPEGAGGVFVSGGTAGNLSALVAARHTAAAAAGARGEARPPRWKIACADTAHSSVISAARVMDVDVLEVPHDERGRLTGATLAASPRIGGGRRWPVRGRRRAPARRTPAWSTTSRALPCVSRTGPVAARRRRLRRGRAARAERPRHLPRDRARRLVHRRPAQVVVRAVRLVRAALPGSVASPGRRTGRTPRTSTRLNTGSDWNASDYAHHLSRRARGLPLWFSLATNGTDAYRDAVERVLAVTRETADEIRRRPELELVMEPELSVILFRRLGWGPEDYEAWWPRVLR